MTVISKLLNNFESSKSVVPEIWELSNYCKATWSRPRDQVYTDYEQLVIDRILSKDSYYIFSTYNGNSLISKSIKFLKENTYREVSIDEYFRTYDKNIYCRTQIFDTPLIYTMFDIPFSMYGRSLVSVGRVVILPEKILVYRPRKQ